MTRWLLVGALRAETLPLLRILDQPRPRSRRLVVGRVGRVEVGVLTVGVGPDKARRRTAAALQAFLPDAVVSVGTCGALVDGHPVGAVRGATRLLRDGALVGTLTPLPGWTGAAVTTEATPCFTPTERERLAAQGAELVEIEAAAVFSATRSAPGPPPFYAAKVVSDLAGGAPDAVISTGRLPDPAAIARFQARALTLVDQRLCPALREALRA